jgi:hypothetical protein
MSMTTHSAFLPRVPTLVAEHIECALADACRRGHAEIIEWAIAPHAPGTEDDSDRFDVLIEFAEPARAPAAFVHAFDETLQRLNAAYRDMRVHGRAPRILEVPPGTFGRWLTGRVARQTRTCAWRLWRTTGLRPTRCSRLCRNAVRRRSSWSADRAPCSPFSPRRLRNTDVTHELPGRNTDRG